jgi:hypothetical protein
MKSASSSGPHRVVGAELHGGVDGLDRPHPFEERVDRLVDHRHQDAVDEEGREVLGYCGGFAQTADHVARRLEGLLGGGDAADQLHELHHRHRVHEVDAQEFFGPVGARGQPRDGDRGGVGG